MHVKPNSLFCFLTLTAALVFAGCGGGGNGDGAQADLSPAFPPGTSGPFYYTQDASGITVYVQNTGATMAPSSYVEITFQTGVGAVVVEAAALTGDLLPGGVSGPITIPLPVGTASTQFTMRVDSRTDVTESDEGNNSVTQPLLI